MASTLRLQVSVVTEMFLDLSLPVADEVKPLLVFLFCFVYYYYYLFVLYLCYMRVPSCDNILQAYRKKNQKKAVHNTSGSSQDGRNSPALTNGNDDIPSMAGSKYQQKKAKKQAKKQAKVN